MCLGDLIYVIKRKCLGLFESKQPCLGLTSERFIFRVFLFRVSKSTTGFLNFPALDILFPWHRYQLEGTNDF